MHPAYSVILFTTLSGAGYGLLVWLAIAARFGRNIAVDPVLGITAFAIALALITVGLGLALWIAFQRPIANWFAGRPVLGGEASRTATLDAAPLRLGAVVVPAVPLSGDNILYIGVGDAAGVLRPDATLTAALADGTPLAIEPGGDGRFRIEVALPDIGPVDVHLEERRAHVDALAADQGRVGDAEPIDEGPVA